MADKLEGSTADGRTRDAAPKPKPTPARPKRKSEPPTETVDLTGKFLRVGNKVYRTSDDKQPIVRVEADRLVTSNIDALPDIIRLAKASGWTSIKINGGDRFKKAAYLAAAAQGLAVENYTPSKVIQAEADRFRTRLSAREERRDGKETRSKPSRRVVDPDQRKVLAERFLSQTNEQNVGDPDLRRAQALVAQAISIARARYPDDPVKASKEVEAKRQKVATQIANGDKIAAIQLRNQQAQRVREVTQDQALKRTGPSR